MLQSKPLELGRLRGTIYDFPEINDILAMHTHSPENVHITIVARGKIRMSGGVTPDKIDWTREVLIGAIIDWEPGQWHEFVGLESNTRIVNIIKA